VNSKYSQRHNVLSFGGQIGVSEGRGEKNTSGYVKKRDWASRRDHGDKQAGREKKNMEGELRDGGRSLDARLARTNLDSATRTRRQERRAIMGSIPKSWKAGSWKQHEVFLGYDGWGFSRKGERRE